MLPLAMASRISSKLTDQDVRASLECLVERVDWLLAKRPHGAHAQPWAMHQLNELSEDKRYNAIIQLKYFVVSHLLSSGISPKEIGLDTVWHLLETGNMTHVSHLLLNFLSMMARDATRTMDGLNGTEAGNGVD